MEAEKIEQRMNRDHDNNTADSAICRPAICVVEYVDQQSPATATNALIKHKLANHHHFV